MIFTRENSTLAVQSVTAGRGYYLNFILNISD